MGKVEDMAAMRQANWAARQKPGPSTLVSRSTLDALAAGKAPAKARAVPAAPATGELCGHQSISNKRCSRPKDHSEKSHRYPKA